MRLIQILLLSLISMPAFTQAQEIAWNKDKPLTWKNFAGVPDAGSPYDVVPKTYMRYSYKWKMRDSLYYIKFELKSLFNTQTSWSKKGKQTKELLRCAQLHFDITELFTRRLYVALDTVIYNRNFKQQISDIYQKVRAQEWDFHKKYDTQSNYSRNRDYQVFWEKYIQKQLAELPANY